ncbi:ExbD/TolR family protein [Roseospira navarrensis]|uniref:Biopolymer transporter ExbD n=1 Tax=Roseospira navarrensis TaxID=140058 RepID=A0A7X1ZEE0_9PROT|nr:biopolymer transporter ExbD [Roseospira navarrensis]MQX35715.1 biopolymer transporter ExbD [Roseospira navarrensis]
MRLSRSSRRAPAETIVALIDVTFFLLVFFLLVGRLDASAPFEVIPPIATSGESLPAGGMTVSMSPAADLALDGQPTERAALVAAVRGRVEAGDLERLRLNVHADAPVRDLLALVAALEETGATPVVLVVTPTPP